MVDDQVERRVRVRLLAILPFGNATPYPLGIHFFGRVASSSISQGMQRCACANGSFTRFGSPARFYVRVAGS